MQSASVPRGFLKTRNMIKLGHKYRNATRHQIVEVTELERGKVCYKVIIGNSNNIIKEFYCSFERFLRLYELD